MDVGAREAILSDSSPLVKSSLHFGLQAPKAPTQHSYSSCYQVVPLYCFPGYSEGQACSIVQEGHCNWKGRGNQRISLSCLFLHHQYNSAEHKSGARPWKLEIQGNLDALKVAFSVLTCLQFDDIDCGNGLLI